MLDLIALTKLFSKIALSHTGEDHKRINTVALCDFVSEINETNLGRNYAHVTEGTYWRRKALTTSDMRKDYGVFMIIPELLGRPDLFYTEMPMQVQLVSALPIVCKGCPTNWKPSTTQLDGINQDILMSYIEQLATKVHLYGFEGDMFFEHEDAPELTFDDDRGTLIDAGYVDNSHQYNFDNFSTGIDNLRMSTTRLKVNNCFASGITFDQAQAQVDAKEIHVKCNSCF